MIDGQEVKDHKVHWGATFNFPCKMMANASTGVMERCVLRISIRKESKGGRSFNKLGFVDLNLAEYAGAGLIHKKALLEGYDTRHRQDNSMLKFKLALNMISGDIVFKAPSPDLSKHKQLMADDTGNEQKSDEFSSGSLAGSIASGSSGFGSLPKKRPALLSSDLVIGQTLAENNIPVAVAADSNDALTQQTANLAVEHADPQEVPCETGHSRNSSNTSQLSKASGYSSIHSHSHSRQSSSGDSGHIRDLHSRSVRTHSHTNNQKFFRTHTYPKKINIPNTIPSSNSEVYSTPSGVISSTPKKSVNNVNGNISNYSTPKGYQSQTSYVSNSSAEEYKTPECSFINSKTDIFSQNFNELQKSSSTSVVERIKSNMLTIDEVDHRKSDSSYDKQKQMENRLSLVEVAKNRRNGGVLRSKSEFEIPRLPIQPAEKSFANKFFKSDSLFSFLTPRPKRKSVEEHRDSNNHSPNGLFKAPASPIPKLNSLPETRTTSLSSLRSGYSGNDGLLSVQLPQSISIVLFHKLNAVKIYPWWLTTPPTNPPPFWVLLYRGLPHRKLLDGTSGGKLAPLAISPDEQPAQTVTNVTVSSDSQNPPSSSSVRRPSVTTNPSTSSLVLSETGSLDRSKAAYERRKKTQAQESDVSSVPGRVEITRVNPDDLIEELLKNTNLEQADDSAETSGLQLFIAKDGTAAVGNHEVKSQMSTGGVFKQVVMDDR
ncbi:hypothetical protein NQ317_008704 [Molorchus minor]|uniref:C2 NT-type domain-containing protein n=1 Tax=Molorchus minor TaxID=1323400 RepID=A0ABQ9J2N8_9CUCU|nr:hypothetical protein NQ317_008704 [Molorchus minor]